MATGVPAVSIRSTGFGSGLSIVRTVGALSARSRPSAGSAAAADWAARPAALELSVLPGPPGVHVGVAELADALG